ncbi:MAG: tRNA (N(6)-L-threonylcarbamoyladenosine(37)-C(2))-methylthiotransferase MtaB [Eubacterium sp.]|nr:tRNA (N(6)-L-threonylcarbamoyladenosine(37)-C(2))-methylthiotransferase MtaB [Eubacterium sp.]
MKYAIFTFGCKVNQYESAVVEKAMKERGFERSEDIFAADAVVINSCCVTENSDKKARQLLAKIKRDNPACVTVLAGCYPQAFAERAKELGADILIGTENKGRIAELICEHLTCGERYALIPERPVGVPYERMDAADMGKTRAYIKIEDGCDRFCSYCIIPYARGSVRSRPIEEIIAEARFQASCGHKEIILVGINMSCYGKDIGLRLADAVHAACSVDGVERVRLSSLEPELLTQEDIARFAAEEKLCPHFHLSLQSGGRETLKRMNRRYTPEEYMGIVNMIRTAFPDAAITTDIMVGFAGETEEEFAESCEFVKSVGFAGGHVFTYSVREGTAAARRTDFVPKAVAAERYKIMSGIVAQLKADYFAAQVGQVREVLVQRRESEEYANGLTPQYVPVRIYGSGAKKHDIVKVRITSACGGDFCIGTEI